MKPIFYFVICLCGLLSCTKSRTCTCSDGQSYTVNTSKKTAEAACAKYSVGGVDCKIN
ncbi:hypothetical protein [Fluviicola chungangensis]|uniref:hypothetical protein n=1 Tax=Fluviicola chungangensis TaxID=2597671 RepID=UPI0016430943|nr:hypothetical protein [Fluviicola chungangensis]